MVASTTVLTMESPPSFLGRKQPQGLVPLNFDQSLPRRQTSQVPQKFHDILDDDNFGGNNSTNKKSPSLSPAKSDDLRNEDTVGASNVSALGLQPVSQQHHQHPDPGESNLSLRDLFSDPSRYPTADVAVTAEGDVESYTKEENDLWEYDDTNTPSDHGAGAAATVLARTPPDSLHHPPPTSSHRQHHQNQMVTAPAATSTSPAVVSKHSTFLVLSKERPRMFQPAGTATTTTKKQLQSEPDLPSYSSDSSSDQQPYAYSRSRSRPPVLYSAIGSLEDPSNSSFKWKKPRSQIKKYEFPASTALIVPPKPVPLFKVAGKSGTLTTVEAREQRRNTEKDAASPREQQPQEPEVVIPSGNDSQPQESTDTKNGEMKEETQSLDSLASKKPSNLRQKKKKANPEGENPEAPKKVQIASGEPKPRFNELGGKSKKKPVEMFRPSSDAYTPRMGKKDIKYKPAEERTPVQKMASGMGTLSRPNFRDALRRVAMIIQQHVVKIERRFASGTPTSSRKGDKLFNMSMKEEFSEDRFITPTYKCTMVRVPMARAGMVYGLKQVRQTYEIPTEREIYEFAHRLFKTVQLSSECSIVCLIYVERLMEEGKVPLLASTWRPIMMTGLLLASKVWQDLSSWNIEFTNVYPQYSLQAIHRLELKFLRILKWDLYISSSLYAKYYFALRSLVEKKDFRMRYNRLCGVDDVQALEALKVEERSTLVKEEALMQLSRSM